MVRHLGDLATAADDVVVTSQFVPSPVGAYLANRPQVQTIQGQQGALPAGSTLSRATRTFYDDLAAGAITRGNPTKVRVDWLRNGTWTVLESDRSFDAYGNLRTSLAARDPNAQDLASRPAREIIYDVPSRTFPTEIRDYSPLAGSSAYRTRLAYTGCGAPAGLGLVCSITDATDQSTTAVYDDLGRLLRVSGPNGAVTAFLHHDGERGTSQQRIEVRTRWAIDGPSGAAVATDPNAMIEVRHLDGLLRPVQETRSGTGANVGRRFFGYDARGEVASVSRWDFGQAPIHPTVFTYDALARVRQQTLADGSKIDTEYGVSLALTTVREQSVEGGAVVGKRGVVTDGHDRIAEIHEYVEPTGSTPQITELRWDPFSQLASVRDPVANDLSLCAGNPACEGQRHETRFFYDEAGNRVRLEDPNTGTWTWTYDAASLVATQTAPDLRAHEFSYDAFGRIWRVHPVNPLSPEVDQIFEYGSPTDSDALTRGRLKRIDDTEGYETFVYDTAGNVEEHVRTAAGSVFTFTKTYDPLGRVSSTEYPDGQLVSWRHDKGLLVRIESPTISMASVASRRSLVHSATRPTSTRTRTMASAI